MHPPTIEPHASRPDLCIALSGGGIRAGAVALGVLQGMYERGILQRASYLTSVSGGGYPVYGILSQATHKKKTLHQLLGEAAYATGVEEHAAFMDTAAIFGGVVNSSVNLLLSRGATVTHATLSDLFHGRLGRTYVVRDSALSSTYAIKIDQTFGLRARGFNPTELQKVVIPDGFPYPIFVASVTDGRAALFEREIRDSADRVFELSPNWIGSDLTSYWGDYVAHLDLSDAIVSSGAAIDTPATDEYAQILPDWVKKIGISLGVSFFLPDGRDVFVADGGFIDNQGVLPLIRRNCAEIIAVDATSDTRLEMQGWSHLSTLASTFGWEVEIPESHGDSQDAGWHLPGHVWTVKFFNEQRPDVQNRLTILKLGFSPIDSYGEEILSFGKENWKSSSWDPVTGCNKKTGLKKRCKFPLEVTGKQSFTSAEFRAYRMLGVHMARAYAIKADAE
jgi:hypothetical protein